MLRKLVLRKHSGQGFGELFSSLLSILALIVVVLFFVGTIQILNRQINMDSVVRAYMLQLEQQGYLTDKQQDTLTEDLVRLGAYNGSYSFGQYSIKIEGWDPANKQWSEQAIDSAVGYGNRVGLKVTMTVPDNEYHPKYWLGQVIEQRQRVREVTITKIQTAKY